MSDSVRGGLAPGGWLRGVWMRWRGSGVLVNKICVVRICTVQEDFQFLAVTAHVWAARTFQKIRIKNFPLNPYFTTKWYVS